MALEKQIASMAITGGLNEKDSDKFKQPPTLNKVKNGKFEKTGEVRKRNSFSNYEKTKIGGGVVDKAVQGASFKDERLVFDGERCHSFVESKQLWADKGRIQGCHYEDAYIERTEANSSSQLAVASANGIRLESWCENSGPPIIDTFNPAVITYHVFSRVVEEESGNELVGKTRITPPDGLPVTTTSATNAESGYINPNVQCVTMGAYIYTLFNGCILDPAVLTASIEHDPVSGLPIVDIDGSSWCGLSEGDRIIVLNTTNYNGTYSILRSFEATNKLHIDCPVKGPDEAVAAVRLDPAYGTTWRLGVYSSRINTAVISEATLTPTTYGSELISDPQDYARYVRPAFYVNGAYPLFNVCPVSNDTITGGAAIMKLTLTPYGAPGVPASTVASYRVDYYEGSLGTFGEFLEDGRAGMRGAPTVILPAEATPYFQSTLSPYAYRYRTLSRITLNEIVGTGTGAPETFLVAVATYENPDDSTIPSICSMVYKANLTKEPIAGQPQPTPIGDQGTILISGSTAPKSFDDPTQSLFIYVMTSVERGGSLSLGGWSGHPAAEHHISSDIIDLWGLQTGKHYKFIEHYSTMTSSLFAYSGKLYFSATYAVTPMIKIGGTPRGPNFGSSFNLVADIDGNVIGSAGTGLCGNCFATDWTSMWNGINMFWGVSRTEDLGDGKFRWGSAKVGGTNQFGLGFNDNRTVFNPSTGYIDFEPPRQLPTAVVGGSIYAAGGILWEYSGARWKESGFLNYPQVRVTGTVATGGVLPDGTYQYLFIYEWTNTNGEIERSYPSDIETVVLAGGGSTQQVQHFVRQPTWSYKRSQDKLQNANIVMYRTEKSKSVFYRVSETPVVFIPIPGVSEGLSEVFDDTLIDLGIINNEQAYTTGAAGDIFGNIAPGGCTDIVLHKERIWVSKVDGTVAYSKKLAPRTAPEFSDFQVIPIEPSSGEIACIGSVRDYMVVITREHAYLIGGDGPNAAGQGVQFSPPTIFARNSGAEVGCARTNSPVGFIYEAKGGIYQVSASMQVQWVGSPVEDTIAASKVLRAVANDAEGEIYFSLDSPTAGLLVYNYVFQTWSNWELSAASFGDVRGWGLFVHDKVLNITLANGDVIRQDNLFIDVGSTDVQTKYPLEVESPWLRTQQFLHLARFYRALISGTYRTDHTLECRVYYNYDESVTDIQTKAVTTANGTPYIFRKHFKHQRARAVKIKISDSNQLGTGEGYSIDGIAIEFGARRGTTTTPADRTLGG